MSFSISTSVTLTSSTGKVLNKHVLWLALVILHRFKVEHVAALETENMGVNTAKVMNPLIFFAEYFFRIPAFQIIRLLYEIVVVIDNFSKVFTILNRPFA